MEYRSYHEQTDMTNIEKLREILKTLPPICQRLFPSCGSPLHPPVHEFPCATPYQSLLPLFDGGKSILQKLPNQVRFLKETDLDRLEAVDIEEYAEIPEIIPEG